MNSRTFIRWSVALSVALTATLPAFGQESDQPASPVYWLARGVREAQRANDVAGDELGQAADALPLLAMAQYSAGASEDLRQTLELIRAAAHAQPDPALAATAFITLATQERQLEDIPAAQADLRAAQAAADLVQGDAMRPLIEFQIACAQGDDGDASGALAAARDMIDPVRKASQYCSLALLANRRGDSDSVAEDLRMARRAAHGQDDQCSSRILYCVGSVEAKLARYADARATADSIVLPQTRADLLRELGSAQWRTGELGGYRMSVTLARDAISHLSGETRVAALTRLAHAQRALSVTVAALETIDMAIVEAGKISDPAEHFDAWMDIAEVQAACGRPDASGRSLIIALTAPAADSRGAAGAFFAPDPTPRAAQSALLTPGSDFQIHDDAIQQTTIDAHGATITRIPLMPLNPAAAPAASAGAAPTPAATAPPNPTIGTPRPSAPAQPSAPQPPTAPPAAGAPAAAIPAAAPYSSRPGSIIIQPFQPTPAAIAVQRAQNAPPGAGPSATAVHPIAPDAGAAPANAANPRTDTSVARGLHSSAFAPGAISITSQIAANRAAAQGLRPPPSVSAADADARFASLAVALANAGSFDAALDIAQHRMHAARETAELFAAIARAEADAKRTPQAIAHLALVASPVSRAATCRAIAAALARQHDLGRLSQWIDSLLAPSDRAYADLGAAEGLLQRRMIDRINVASFELELE